MRAIARLGASRAMAREREMLLMHRLQMYRWFVGWRHEARSRRGAGADWNLPTL